MAAALAARPVPRRSPFGTNLWIEILKVTNSQAFLRLHNTVSGEFYQLQSKTNLTPANNVFWIPGEIITATGTNVDFSPVDASPAQPVLSGRAWDRSGFD